jgi:hypothetical protein
MKRILEGAPALGFTLAVVGLGLSAAVGALTPGAHDLPPARYIGEEHAAAQQALAVRPAEQPAPTF